MGSHDKETLDEDRGIVLVDLLGWVEYPIQATSAATRIPARA
jgi:hypothetical protein